MPTAGDCDLVLTISRKKFLKIRHDFKGKMGESNILFDEEQKAVKLARRLQEQNEYTSQLSWNRSESHTDCGSQLLDLLLDVNESNRIPPHIRYDLRSPTPDALAVPALEPDHSPSREYDTNAARAALEDLEADNATGQISPRSYNQNKTSLLDMINKPKLLANFYNTPHTTLDSLLPDNLPSDLDDDTPTGYLSPDHEDEFLSNLDIALGDAPLDARPIMPSQLPKPSARDKEKDALLRNPVSVYNWLRKHHPQVFLQDDSSTDKPTTKQTTKPSPKPSTNPTKASKRTSAAPKLEQQEILDDEGFLVEGILDVPVKTKRKREDEPYRPKGGSSRSTKKKKTSGGAAGRKNAGDGGGA